MTAKKPSREPAEKSRRPAAARRQNQRLQRRASATLQAGGRSEAPGDQVLPTNAVVDCGWGRLIFAHTFDDAHALADAICDEKHGARDIAFYLNDPHVVLALRPQELFLDPSHTYRLWMTNYRPAKRGPQGFIVRRLKTRDDAVAINRIYSLWNMVQVDPDFFFQKRSVRELTYLVAEDVNTGNVIGAVTGIDHVQGFDDPENGSSLWCLAVDPQAHFPGVGEALVRQLAEHYAARGRSYLDLSVIHDNTQAIALYEKLGFQRVPVFTVKHKNIINEQLYSGPPVTAKLNPYAMIIINEARRRGIAVDVQDEISGFFKLIHGGRSITCRESLSQLTDSIAMSRCDDKALTRRILQEADVRVPGQMVAGEPKENLEFLNNYGSIVVKPARGEQGRGITVDITNGEDMENAIEAAQAFCDTVLLEEFVRGQDLRVIVIGYHVVAAAIRRPAEITGTGRHSIKEMIEAQSRRRQKATGGESKIPLDRETERCVRAAGYSMDDILPKGNVLQVRKTANLHTGGTIHDVTERMHYRLVDAAVRCARALSIPVVGLDFLVPRIDESDYVVIEANERPGLANHEPQPTAERFIDLLFPQTASS